MTATPDAPTAETWLKSSELAVLWKVDSKTVTRYATHWGLPFIETPGGHRRYQWAVAEAWRESLADRREALRAESGARLSERHAERRNGQGS